MRVFVHAHVRKYTHINTSSVCPFNVWKALGARISHTLTPPSPPPQDAKLEAFLGTHEALFMHVYVCICMYVCMDVWMDVCMSEGISRYP